MSTVPVTPYLLLNLPPTGFPSWGGDVNQNFTIIDQAVGALQNSYQGEWVDNLNYSKGQIVTYQGGVYMSLASPNVNLPPDEHPEAWGSMGAESIMPYPQPGIAVSAGSSWAPSIDPATMPGFPNAGVPVSTATAWGASIDPATLVRTNPNIATLIELSQGGTQRPWTLQGTGLPAIPGNGANAAGFIQLTSGAGQGTTGTTGQTGGNAASIAITGGVGGPAPVGGTNGIGGAVFIDGGKGGNGPGTPPPGRMSNGAGRVYIQSGGGETCIGSTSGIGWLRITPSANLLESTGNAGANGGITSGPNGWGLAWNLSNAAGETDFVNYRASGGGGFAWYNLAPSVAITPTTPVVMNLDQLSVLHILGGLSTGGNVQAIAGTSLLAVGHQIGGWATDGGFGGNPQPRLQLAIAGTTGTSYPAYFEFYTTSSMNGANATGDSLAIRHNTAMTTGPGAGQSSVLMWLSRAGILAVAGNVIASGQTSYVQAGLAASDPGNNDPTSTTPKLRLTLGVNGQSAVAYPAEFRFKTQSNPNVTSTLDLLSITHYDTNAGERLCATFEGGGYLNMIGGYRAGAGVGPNKVQPASLDFYQNEWRAVAINPTAGQASAGGMSFYGYSLDFQRSAYYIHCSDNGTAQQVSIGGNLYASGTITSGGSKAFLVPHPLDETKDLIHACLEGPENGVFYRGEVVLVDGAAEVTLPDYFEPLTFPEDRSVLLTQVDDDRELAMLAASRIIDGKFHIRSSVKDATVAWEVKAVRRIGVEHLEVVTEKTLKMPPAPKMPFPIPELPPSPKEETDGERQTATDRDGDPEAGKLRPEAQPDAKPAATDRRRSRRVPA